MRKHSSFIAKAPVDKKSANAVDAKLKEAKEILAEAKSIAAQPNSAPLNLSALESIVTHLAELAGRPKEIAITVIRSKAGEIISMIGTTDPEKIAAIQSSNMVRVN